MVKANGVIDAVGIHIEQRANIPREPSHAVRQDRSYRRQTIIF